MKKHGKTVGFLFFFRHFCVLDTKKTRGSHGCSVFVRGGVCMNSLGKLEANLHTLCFSKRCEVSLDGSMVPNGLVIEIYCIFIVHVYLYIIYLHIYIY